MLSLNQCRQNFFKSVISTGDLLLKKVKTFTKRYFFKKKNYCIEHVPLYTSGTFKIDTL